MSSQLTLKCKNALHIGVVEDGNNLSIVDASPSKL